MVIGSARPRSRHLELRHFPPPAARASRGTSLLAALAALVAVACGTSSEETSGAGGATSAGGFGAQAGHGGPGGAPGGAGGTIPDAPLLGVYAVTGEEQRYGTYTGLAEIYDPGDGGPLRAAHTAQWDSADFEGLAVADAWQGEVSVPATPLAPTLTLSLDRVGFVTSYGGESRSADVTDNGPVALQADLVRTGPTILSVVLVAPAEPAPLTRTEIWTYQGPSGGAPIWQNAREARPGHDPLSDTEKTSLFATFATYHQRPEVAPYVNRPEFQAAMHYFVFDPTDFQFYRDNPGVVRVLQKILDPISLAESRERAQAYAPSLVEKQAAFDATFPAQHLDAAGMFCSFDPAAPVDVQKIPSGDGILWTAVYVASQAERYLVTGDGVAIDNLMPALEGMLLCSDIAPIPGDFARTVRPHRADLSGGWVQGLGSYAGYDWLPGANNDMLQGYFIGFTWAYLALAQQGGHDQTLDRMRAVLDELLDSCPLIDVSGMFEQNIVVNRAKALLVDYLMSGDLLAYLEYEGYYPVISQWLVDMGNGSTYEYGISDWSGNHLNLQSLLVLLVAADHAAGPINNLESHAADYRVGMAQGLDRMRDTRIGLLQLVYGALGTYPSPPPELEDAIWVLREMPVPKAHEIPIDWRVNPSFCMSPFPSLPWKMDWADPNSDRFQSLVSVPLFERPADGFEWKSNPKSFRGGQSPVQEPGADFLFAYWFGRWAGVIDASQ
jgi:hypothetical protein